MIGLLKISLPNYNIVTNSAKKLFPISIIILVAGLLYGSYILGTHATNNKEKDLAIAQVVKPTPTVTPTAIPTPTLMPTAVPEPTTVYPSQEALKIAALTWVTSNPTEQQNMMSKYGGSNESEAINDLAIYLTENPTKLAELEAIANLAQQQSSQPVYQPQMPVHCTTSYIGMFANTNCN